MTSSVKKIFFADFVFNVPENVYEPAEDSFLLAENLEVKESCWALDIGTGCGILGVIAAKKGANVVATDINPGAVRCARKNAETNGVVNRVLVLRGDMFCPLRLRKQFDLIICNAPYLPSEDSEKECWAQWAWEGGLSGRNFIDKFISEVPKYLRPTGEVLLMQSTLSDVEKTLQGFKEEGLDARVIAEQDLPFFEKIVLVGACGVDPPKFSGQTWGRI